MTRRFRTDPAPQVDWHRAADWLCRKPVVWHDAPDRIEVAVDDELVARLTYQGIGSVVVRADPDYDLVDGHWIDCTTFQVLEERFDASEGEP